MGMKKDKLDILQSIKIECPHCHNSFGSVSYMLHIGGCGLFPIKNMEMKK
jgi:hypothetical protein